LHDPELRLTGFVAMTSAGMRIVLIRISRDRARAAQRTDRSIAARAASSWPAWRCTRRAPSRCRTELRLDVGGALSASAGAASRRDAIGTRRLRRDAATLRQAEDLIAAAVGEDRRGPADEPMQTPARAISARRDADTVVGVAEDDLGAEILESRCVTL
jgi:hypothetical protein